MTTISAPIDVSNLPELIRVDEAAAVLRVSSGLVRQLIAAGELRAVRLGRLVRIPRAEIQRLISGDGVVTALGKSSGRSLRA